jgi:endoglucanase
LQLINFTPGTRSNADYTYPALAKQYRTSAEIYQSILQYEANRPGGLNGFLLLTHIGADPRRTDKFYRRLDTLITTLKQRGYHFNTLEQVLQ